MRDPQTLFARATQIKNEIKSIIDSPNGNHSDDYLNSRREKVDSQYQKIVNQNTLNQDLDKRNTVEAIKNEIRNKQEAGKLTEADVNKALTDITSALSGISTGLDLKSERDAHTEIKNDYAASVIQPLMNILQEKTDGKGVSPVLVDKAYAIANSKDIDQFNEFVKDLDKDSALYLIADGLFKATQIKSSLHYLKKK